MPTKTSSLSEYLDTLTRPGELVEPAAEAGALRCVACGHRCLIRPGRRGICQVRFNQDGELRVPWGYVAAAQLDPIEKKPFTHVLPGAKVLTFGMLGCDFHCGYCQNWLTSQALKDPAAEEGAADYVQPVTPRQFVAMAQRMGAEVIASSYNEPLITAEWAVSIFRPAVEAGIRCAFVSNGNATKEALAYLRPYLTAYKVDLKTMQDKHYRELGGVLDHVLDTIRMVHDLGIWLEVVTLVVPGFNDSPEELWQAARFLASVSPDIPWHVTAFHPDYKMQDRDYTHAATLQQAADIGQEAGLRYVYAGNLPGRVGSLEDTHCPQCGYALIRRRGYTVFENKATPTGGKCPRCGSTIPGVWN